METKKEFIRLFYHNVFSSLRKKQSILRLHSALVLHEKSIDCVGIVAQYFCFFNIIIPSNRIWNRTVSQSIVSTPPQFFGMKKSFFFFLSRNTHRNLFDSDGYLSSPKAISSSTHSYVFFFSFYLHTCSHRPFFQPFSYPRFQKALAFPS